ncbi:MAG: hypothetical protein MAG453_01434 [Calditrichaeota bacterium]|nr:hypothetical protein [Calditrichota bacterium]
MMKRSARWILFAAVAAGLVFVSAAPANAQGPWCPYGPGKGWAVGPGPHGIWARADLSEKQMDEMLELQKEMQATRLKTVRERRELMEEMRELMDDPDANRDRIGAIGKEIAELDLRLEKQRRAHHEKMVELLTDEQWALIATDRGRGMRGMMQPGPGFGRGNCPLCPGYGYGPGFYGPRPGFGRGPRPGYGPHGPGYGRQGGWGW